MIGWHSRGSWALLCASGIATVTLLAMSALQYQRLTQQNPCNMTYSNPNYRRLPVDYSAAPYELLQYENGNKFELEPHPVLFIPGSLGSYKQARSIGAVASKSKQLQLFALDFKDEPTALHAYYVMQQAVFVNEAIKAIQALYEAKHVKAAPIVLVGHSYGGLAGMLSLLLNNHPTGSVDLVVMLSTPVMRPPFHPDASFELTYRTMSSIWRRSLSGRTDCAPTQELHMRLVDFVPCATSLQNVTMVSISGGDRDFLVRDGITRIAGPASNQSFSVSSHALKRVRFGIDHKAILWCNQLLGTVVHGIHSWTRLPTGQRNISFWVDHLDGAANAQPVTNSTMLPEQALARMPHIETNGESTAARYDRLISTMGVTGGAVYVAAVDHAPLALMALTALACWTLARLVLSQLLGLPVDMSPRLSLLIPDLASIFHGWLLGPLVFNQILPPPLARYLLATSSSNSSGGFVLLSIVMAVLAILIGGVAYVSQQGSEGIAILVWVLPTMLAFGVAILLSAVIAICLVALRCSFAPIAIIARGAFRMMTSSRQGRSWRKKLERSSWVRALVPLGLFAFAMSSYVQSARGAMDRSVGAMLLVALSILYYTAYRTFCIQWLGLLLYPSLATETAGYQLLLTLLYFPIAFLAYPTSSLASRILFERYPPPGVFRHLVQDLLIYLLCLLAVIVHLHLSRTKKLSVPQVPQWHILVKPWTSLSATPSMPSQVVCLHEDGGDRAIYELTDHQCQKLAPGVYLGPMFRVAWCDCSRDPKLPMAEYCEWCKCKQCGNKGSSAMSSGLQGFGEISAPAVVSLCIGGLSMVVPWCIGEYTFRNMFALAAMATLLAIQHTLANS